MRLHPKEQRRLPFQSLTNPTGNNVYSKGVFLRNCWFHLVSVLRESRIHSGSSWVSLIHLSSVLLKNFGLVILPICSVQTVNCTPQEADYELVNLVAFLGIYRGDCGGIPMVPRSDIVSHFQYSWRVTPRSKGYIEKGCYMEVRVTTSHIFTNFLTSHLWKILLDIVAWLITCRYFLGVCAFRVHSWPYELLFHFHHGRSRASNISQNARFVSWSLGSSTWLF